MLAGLGHHAVVGRHHHQRQVDGPHPRQHVAHEPLVPGDVDEAEHVIRIERVVREPEVDGEPPLLLLGEAIGVDPGERAHQRGLAVVDVAGGGDDHGASGRPGCARRLASSSGAAQDDAEGAERHRHERRAAHPCSVYELRMPRRSTMHRIRIALEFP